MDKFAEWIAGLGVPGLVLFIAIATSGWAGGAAILTALAGLGPGGVICGIISLGIIGIISGAITKWGVKSLEEKIIEKMLLKGNTPEDIWSKIESYPVSTEYKDRAFRLLFEDKMTGA
ncbi:MAG: hypothetical protein GC165_07630 [Armatimonadetes bacterium]|nr:hypothetical protein [Armatimonadota bacterium]